MPVVGFRDASGKKLRFAEVDKGIWDQPLPVIRWLATGFRAPDHYGDPDALSVTTLIAPPQIVQLERRHDVYVKPLDNLWAGFGTVVHQLLELQSNDLAALQEQKMVYEYGGVKVGGTLDRYEVDKACGYDYKVIRSYAIKKMKYEGVQAAHPEYYHQASGYKSLLYRTLDHKARRWQLVCIARDWAEKDRRGKQPIEPIEIIDVPLMPLEAAEAFLQERVVLHKAAELCGDEGLPSCSPAETWGSKRCESYCSVSSKCYQWNTKLSLGNQEHAQR